MCGIWGIFGSAENVCLHCSAAHNIAHRGPDNFRIENFNHLKNCCIGFHRLAIVDDATGMQPLSIYSLPHVFLIYNGEIYNHKQLSKQYDLPLSTHVDGEPMVHLYEKLGAVGMAQHLDGVFAFCIVDTKRRQVALGRDTFGLRPLFRIRTSKGFLGVCSEAKGLYGMANSISEEKMEQFPPGCVEIYDLDSNGLATLKEQTYFYRHGDFLDCRMLTPPSSAETMKDIQGNIRRLLESAVDKRLMADRRIGCLLSGGLDSSLVTALVVKLVKERGISYPVQTFSIGMEGSPDLLAARKVANHLKTEHHEVLMTAKDGLDAINEVIYHLESFDTSSIRASIGMYLVSKYIKQNTDTTVILSGEGADELAQGYHHFQKAPNAVEADKESRRLLKDLYLFDVLRCDRTTAAWGLEVRVPFLDHEFTSYYLSIDPELRHPREGIEKSLLRSSFSDLGLLPDDILWRSKLAFSDGLSNIKRPWFQIVQEHVANDIKDATLEEAPAKYPINSPKTKETLHYRHIFETHFPNKGHFTPHFWKAPWSNSDEPSSIILQNCEQ